MKQILITLSLFGAWAPHYYASAQPTQQQTVVIEDDAAETVIEIKEGNVFVDGKKVAPYDLKHHLKIIRKFGNAQQLDVHMDGDTPADDLDLSMQRGQGADRGVIVTNRPMLGVQSQPTANNAGAQVQVVSEGSPAGLSGVRPGDIITKLDNVTITSPQDLAAAVLSYKPNDKVDITFQRDGQEKTIAVVLAEQPNYSNAPQGNAMPDLEELMRNFQNMGQQFENGFQFSWPNRGDGDFFSQTSPRTAEGPKIGATVEERADADGLLVNSVKPGSTAEKAGLKPGDVITTVGGRKMTNVDDLSTTLYELKNKRDIVVSIKRGAKTETLYIEMPVELRKKEF